MAIYWHPFLTQLLREDYEEQLIIEDEVSLGEMPLRLDVLIRRSLSSIELPAPFCYLGLQTIVEYKGPGDTAEHADLVQLEIYGLLYQHRNKIWGRQEVTLWLVASDFQELMSLTDGAHLEAEAEVSPGVISGTLDGFPIFLIDLNEIPLNDATLSLVMVSKGKREQELVAYVLDDPERLARYLPYIVWLHWDTLEEVLQMRKLSLEEIGVDFERVIQHFDIEEIQRHLVRMLGKEKVRQLIDQVPDESSTEDAG